MTDTTTTPSVLFVCVHNAGRSQMAAGFLSRHRGRPHRGPLGRLHARRPDQPHRCGSHGGARYRHHRRAAQGAHDEAVQASDVVITMGCGDACPFFPGKRYEDWKLDDPAGQGIDAVRPIRDDIRARIEQLVSELL